jgi:geranylgeranyl diphosphate synthase type II
MDNDDLRRGRLTCHRAFGEDVAILAGDALLTEAFGVIARCEGASCDVRLRAISLLSGSAGVFGMIGGQTMDTCIPRREVDADYLEKTQNGKTGALIAAACRLGCLAAGLSDGPLVAAADAYAQGIGLAFQVCDDVLDATGDEKTLGKPIGSDAKAGKTTFYTLLGRDGALAYAKELTERAVDAVRPFARSERAISLAESLLLRKS